MEFVRDKDLHQHAEASHFTGQTDGSSSNNSINQKSDNDLRHDSNDKDVDYKPEEDKVKVSKTRKR